MAEIKLTTAQITLLRILEEADPNRLTGREIAQKMWPDSPGHRVRPHRHDGRNGGKGATMPMLGAKAGWALVRLGLAYQYPRLSQTTFGITQQGETALRRLQEV